MASSPQSDVASDLSKIAAARKAWIAAVKDGDADRLIPMVAGDVVRAFGNERCVFGKEKLETGLTGGFGRFDSGETACETVCASDGSWQKRIHSRVSRRRRWATLL